MSSDAVASSSISTVSYTHLDVYKRQASYSPVDARPDISPPKIISGVTPQLIHMLSSTPSTPIMRGINLFILSVGMRFFSMYPTHRHIPSTIITTYSFSPDMSILLHLLRQRRFNRQVAYCLHQVVTETVTVKPVMVYFVHSHQVL